MNLYGYAAGDPINNSDPFGLDPFVQCRTVEGGAGSLGFSHCGIRVVDPSRNLDVLIEMIPEMRDGVRMNEHRWNSARGYPESEVAFGKYNAAGWEQISRPAGMSEAEFDDAILNGALAETIAGRGQEYSPRGDRNSNSFVYRSVKRAGGKVPGAAAAGKSAPGICGGKHSNGTDCSPQ